MARQGIEGLQTFAGDIVVGRKIGERKDILRRKKIDLSLCEGSEIELEVSLKTNRLLPVGCQEEIGPPLYFRGPFLNQSGEEVGL
jgi:hypothetical protein